MALPSLEMAEARTLSALFAGDTTDLLLVVLDHLTVQHMLPNLAPVCRRTCEAVRIWFPWRAKVRSWAGISSKVVAARYLAAADLLPTALMGGGRTTLASVPELCRALPRVMSGLLQKHEIDDVQGTACGSESRCDGQAGDAKPTADDGTKVLPVGKESGGANPRIEEAWGQTLGREWAVEHAPNVMQASESLLGMGSTLLLSRRLLRAHKQINAQTFTHTHTPHTHTQNWGSIRQLKPSCCCWLGSRCGLTIER